jgi:hypothetical protein
MKPEKDGPAGTDGIHRQPGSVWLQSLNGYALSLLTGLFAGVLFVPGDGNPGHIFAIAVVGFCGLLLWVRRTANMFANIGLCIVLMVVSWPIGLALRDSTAVLMPDLSAGHLIIGWLWRLLPAALLVTGTARWAHTRSWAVLAIAILPLSAQIAYVALRSPIGRQIDRIEWCGILVTERADGGYRISVIHNKGDNVIQAAFEDLKTLPGLKSVCVQSKKITDEGLCLLSRLPELESLELVSVPVSRRGLECLSQMPRLRRLWLSRVPRVSDDISPLIGSRSLQTLVISDCDLGDEAMVHVAKLKALRTVSFVDTAVSSRAIEKLKADRPDVRVDYSSPVPGGLRSGK